MGLFQHILKLVFLTTISMLYFNYAYSQIETIKKDTISIIDNKILVAYKVYKDARLSEIGTAYEITTIERISRIRFLAKWIGQKKDITCLYPVGEIKLIDERNYVIKENYKDGNLIRQQYFNNDGLEITTKEFYGEKKDTEIKGNKLTIGP